NNNPSNKILIIGITGTKGKSSGANFIWSALQSCNIKTGILSTANIKIGEKEYLNNYHMTMPSPFIIQKFIKRCLKENCEAVIIETTSEGIKQYRHIGINYDIVIFTNLTPEHIESHGSFENYRKAKQQIFKNLIKNKKKILPKFGLIKKTIIVNGDSPEYYNFYKFKADQKIIYGILNKDSDVKADIKFIDKNQTVFIYNNKEIKLNILGEFNVYNALCAIAVSKALNLNIDLTIKGLESLKYIPGRMEIIQKNPFMVIIDYAHEKNSLSNVLITAKKLIDKGRIIIVIGAEGGGRDVQKRFLMGELAAQLADFVIITNVDPYDEDPIKIIDDIKNSALKNGKILNTNLFTIPDRKEAITKALKLAKEKDIVIITGKGSEQSMVIKDKRIKWDDREITKKILYEINMNNN
ncbi:MAG: UDP-N-acetylmuramoyl-L-alanyl-D-glutamate--2,6-diaminopimelate ligase, partial [bacterium]|nr:UDP-N-acetylmuramoyl-L-alanyl-D-glutamate--2,6-diaminopimelate ligase [bacterium]